MRTITLSNVTIVVMLIAILLTLVLADGLAAQQPLVGTNASADFDAQEFVDKPVVEKGPLGEGRPVELRMDALPASPIKNGASASLLAPDVPMDLVLDDGLSESDWGVNQGSGGPSIQFIWLNRFTPDPIEFPFDLNQIQVFFNSGTGVNPGDAIDLVVYQDADGYPANGATWLATFSVLVQAADGVTWSVYDLDPAVAVSGPGDVLIGVINRFVETGVTSSTYPAALDEGTSQGRSWLGWWDGSDPPDPALLPPNDTFSLVDNFGGEGTWLIRGYGETAEWLGKQYLPFISGESGSCPPGRLTPNDPGYAWQWGLDMIDAPRAWFCDFQGTSEVIVAVIDTGVDMEHPEFAGKLVPGRDWAYGDYWPDDDHGHGTHVAGIVGAMGNNGVGVAGVAWNTSIMPLKTLRADGWGYTSWSREAVIWAVEQDPPADVINLSLGSIDSSTAFQDAVDYARSRGALVVASAGNCGDWNYRANGCDYQDQPSYPGAYNNVLAVASTDSADTQSSFSTSGNYVDIAAPGDEIYSTLAGGYGWMSGTSQASPHVAGLAALIKAAHPDYDPDQIAYAIQATAVDLGAPGRDVQYGWGRIDAAAALEVGVPAHFAVESAQVETKPLTRASGAEIAPGVVVVKFRPGISSQAAESVLDGLGHDVQIAGFVPQIDLLELSVPVGSEWDVIEALRALPQVAYAEPDPVIRIR